MLDESGVNIGIADWLAETRDCLRDPPRTRPFDPSCGFSPCLGQGERERPSRPIFRLLFPIPSLFLDADDPGSLLDRSGCATDDRQLPPLPLSS